MGTALITVFFAFVLHRFLSGVRNGMLYNPKEKAPAAPTIISIVMVINATCMMSITLQVFAGWSFLPSQVGNMLSIIAFLVAMLSGIMAMQYGKQPRIDLHLWVQLEQMALSVPFLFIGRPGIAVLVCSAYPAVFTQKAAINRLTDQDVFYNGTDDPTGQYYSIPSLGIKVPRTTQRFRMWAAFISIILFVAYLIYETRTI